MTKKELDEYFQSETAKFDAESQTRIKDKGYAEFFNAPIGETRMTVKYQLPKNIESKYGSRKVFRIIVEDKEYDYTVSEKSPLYRHLVRCLANAKSDVDIVLVRIGTGKSTKYDVKEA